MDDTAQIMAAAGRFWLAWTLATTGGGDAPPTDLVNEVHDAARELIRPTKTRDLRGAYRVLDDLVLRIRQHHQVPPSQRRGLLGFEFPQGCCCN